MKRIFTITAIACLCACNCTPAEKPEEGKGPETETPEVVEKDVTTYVTMANQTLLFKKSGFDFSKPGSMSPNQVTYDKSKTLQEIDGFGLAVTTASCYNLLQMPQAERTAFLTELFSKERIRL